MNNLKRVTSKRGFLLAEETLKIIVALICILFLVYLLVSLYFNNQDAKDLEWAKASLEHLVNEINAGATEVEIYNPEGGSFTYWWLFIWPYGGDSIKPKFCSNLNWKKCMCICGIDSGITRQDAANKCDELGVCLEFNSNLKIDNPSWSNTDDAFELKDLPLTLNIDYNKNVITKR
ncbi:MAG: hypothetical protein AABX88_01135 [Nanoarchaeota archaeon]